MRSAKLLARKAASKPTAPPQRRSREHPLPRRRGSSGSSEEAMRGRASHLGALLSRALSPSLPPPGRALPHVLGGSPPSVERWTSVRPCGSGAEMLGAGFLGRARFFSSDAAAATQGGPKAPAAAAAGTAGGEGGGDGQSGKSEQADAGKAVRGGPVSWLSFLLLLVTGGGIIVYYDKEKKRHIEELKNRTSAVKPGQSVGTAAIGGPFMLRNHDGKPVTEKDFLGKWTLLYFGFTHCPDICPDELQKMAAAIDKIKEKAKLDVVPVFITVDPERDTVEQVRDYVKEFHPDLIGLTGTTDEVRQVARAYRVYYMKTEEEGSDYLVDHSIVMYLMSPEMKFVKFYGKNYDTDSLADGIIKEIKEHK